MSTLTLRHQFQTSSTVVENDFIDHYMAKANGEYVKIYLLLLRHIHTPDQGLSVSYFADCLDCTEKDVVRALHYWAEVGLLSLKQDTSGKICELTLEALPRRQAVAVSPAPVSVASSEAPSKPQTIRQPAIEEQNQLKQLYFVAEQYLGKPLSHTDVCKINYFYDTLHFSIDLIEYLIEYCVENGHKSMHYIESVARAWSDRKIKTVTEAKTDSQTYNKNCFMVLHAFGIKGRNPAELEINYIRKWVDEYGFTLEMILEACNRTIANTHQPDFKYTDSILKNWRTKGVRTPFDIQNADLAYQKEREAKKQAATPKQPSSASNNRFNNFNSRSYDMSSLEQQLLNTP